ncbi:septum formation initiator [Flavobacterium davisii]|uniref:Septum formation initiator n=1 Tax=Flavobacterium davisii TaxID=2906077 RepID=A0A246GLH7_9FLAO|nr:septum formation initiator family protein [Flavobacterium davisii]OWP85119.1 septum formation initiator [Flavobacterium davisii]
MFQSFKNFLKRKYWFKTISNKYFLVSAFFLTWMFFLDNYSYLDHQVLNKEIEELEDNKKYYKEEIAKDLEQIKKLKSSNEIEKYAREKYYMKRENEDIYIIEFENDTLK